MLALFDVVVFEEVVLATLAGGVFRGLLFGLRRVFCVGGAD